MLGLNVCSETTFRTRTRGMSRWGTLGGVFGIVLLSLGMTQTGPCPLGQQPPAPTPAVTCTDATVNVDCNDDDPCTTEVCDIAEGETEGECGDSTFACSDEDHCTDAGCVACLDDTECADDGNSCTDEACVDGSCSSTNNTDACDDEDACTENDACAAGACAGTDIAGCCAEDADCDDTIACTDDTCVAGACVFTNDDTNTCDDGNDCTDGDACAAGVCAGTAIADCCTTDADCTAPETCNLTTGLCEAACTDDAGCDDTIACTDDTCTAGVCANADNCAAGTLCDMVVGAGTCVGCVDDSDCPAATPICTSLFTCVECEATADCASGLTCVSNSCISSLTFTLNQDNLFGTTGNDTFSAPFETTAFGTQVSTMQTGDSADGKAGADVLNASFIAAGTVVPTSLANIETMNFTAFAATTLTATGVSGVDTINSTNSVATLTVGGLQELTDFGFSGVNDATVGMALTFATAGVTSGSTDTITGTLTGSIVGTVGITTAAANGFETVGLVSSGATANTLTTLTQTTGTSMATANISGTQALTLTVMPATIRTYNASTLTGALTLGAGTTAATYVSFATVDIANMTGGTGNDTFIFAGTLDGTDADQTGEKIDGGDGTDVVQGSFGASIGTALPLQNVEELRFNATASGISLNIGSSNTTLKTFTNDADGTANTVTLLNVPHSATTVLNFRGTATQIPQFFDTLTYTGTGVTGSSDALTVNINNRGTALNTSGTTNQFTVGTLTADNVEVFTVAATDGPVASFGLSATGMTSFTISAASTGAGTSAVTMPALLTTGGADTITTINASGVTGNFSITAAVVDVASGASITLGAGDDTLSIAGSGGASATISAGAGGDTITGSAQADIINGEAGNDNLTGGAGIDTINGGAGNDTITGGTGADVLSGGGDVDTFVTVVADVGDTISDFTTGTDRFDWNTALSSTNAAVTTPAFVSAAAGVALTVTETIHELTGTTVATQTAANVVTALGATATNADLDANLLFVIYTTGGGAAIWNWINVDADVEAGELTLVATLTGVAADALVAADFP